MVAVVRETCGWLSILQDNWPGPGSPWLSILQGDWPGLWLSLALNTAVRLAWALSSSVSQTCSKPSFNQFIKPLSQICVKHSFNTHNHDKMN